MPAHSRSSNFEFSIPEDELEQHRIQLEQNLQHTDISLHLSSTAPDDCSDVEYPRHNVGSAGYPGFSPFHPSSGQFDPNEEHSYYHGWSYRTADDDDGLVQYEGRTISTAAHHASALTLSAGLGGRGSRRDASLSGAEYDPDRPLQGIIAGFGTRIQGLDGDSTKSRQFTLNVDFDPLVVDDSAEVAGLFHTNEPPVSIPALGFRSPGSTSSSSRPSTPMSPRPKLSDALHHVAFSPKRPRNGQAQFALRSPAAHVGKTQTTVAPPPNHRHDSPRYRSENGEDLATPKSRRSTSSYSRIYQQSLSYAAPIEPEVNVLPPTPGNVESASRFTKMARGLAKEIQERGRQENLLSRTARRESGVRELDHVKTDDNKIPLRSVISELQDPHAAQTKSAGSLRRTKVYLPDVTGLTSVVTSPAKVGLQYVPYNRTEDFEVDVRLATTLNVVQSKLAFLESENSISRRRVRELELELEECKQQVARERSKVLQRGQVADQQLNSDVRGEPFISQERDAKGKLVQKANNATSPVEDKRTDIDRYKEAVEEKKALEALIFTLRAHLSRLTTELSDHHCLLKELRSLRDSDVRALKEKSHDIDQLRQEVERLSGEVEVLRGVVEEGLKERREARQQAEHGPHSDKRYAEVARQISVSDDEEEHLADPGEPRSYSSEAGTLSGRSIPSPRPSPKHLRIADRTVRTDQATVGSPIPGPSGSQPFVTPHEIQRIVEEVSERRSERSASAVSDVAPRAYSPISPIVHMSEQSSDLNQSIEASDISADITASSAQGYNTRRPGEPTTKAEPGPAGPRTSSPPEAPFPQIRGEYLEKLFFSAPEHNTNTCTFCHRRRNATYGGTATTHHRADPRGAARHGEEDDEGFVEGSEDPKLADKKNSNKGKQRETAGSDNRLPPQTVVARILRELEDDFTHYKGIYIELADQYKVIDAVSNVAKRNVLAEHLREVIDILEQKGDQIASLYDLLTFKDKPVQESVVPERASGTHGGMRSWSRVQFPRK